MPTLSASDLELFPITANLSRENNITVGGCDLADLAIKYGTPLYVYDKETIRHMCQLFLGNFRENYENSHVEYSSKAFANPTVSKIIEKEGLKMDIVTGGELAFAKSAGFSPQNLNFHGNNKDRHELSEALAYGVGRITIDSFHEIELLNHISSEFNLVQPVLLRLSPSVDPHTHLLTTTGVLDSKFGFSIETGAAEESVKKAMSAPNLEVMGFHFHLGSPIFQLEPYTQAIDYVLDFAARMEQQHGLKMKEFNPGGGFAIGYTNEKLPPSIEEYAYHICNAVKTGCDKYGLDEPALTVEPGRAIIGRAGVAIYQIGGIKRIPNVRVYVSVDGGMGDNIRPALYGSEYTVRRLTDPYATPNEQVTIVGKYCESGDFLARDVILPTPKSGEFLCTPAAGAYAVPMASNYNMSPRPAILLVNDGDEQLIRKRETYEDLLSTSLV